MAYSNILELPFELLLEVLYVFDTKELIRIATTCTQFCGAIIELNRRRQLLVTKKKDYTFQLRGHHPSDDDRVPSWLCKYRGTDGETAECTGLTGLSQNTEFSGRLGELSSLYSHFQPTRAIWPSLGQTPDWIEPELPAHLDPQANVGPSSTEESAAHCCFVDAFERFSTMCVEVDITQKDIRAECLSSRLAVGQGFVRIFRIGLENDQSSEEGCPVPDFAIHDHMIEETRDRTLWVSSERNIGLMVRISMLTETKFKPGVDRLWDAEPASYLADFRAVIVRTSYLASMIDMSAELRERKSEKVIHFGRI